MTGNQEPRISYYEPSYHRAHREDNRERAVSDWTMWRYWLFASLIGAGIWVAVWMGVMKLISVSKDAQRQAEQSSYYQQSQFVTQCEAIKGTIFAEYEQLMKDMKKIPDTVSDRWKRALVGCEVKGGD